MAAPCQVDFYVLQDGAQSADRLACRLALMAWEQGHTALLVAADETEAEHLDALLWETPPGRFVPHGRAGLEGPEPVTIGTRADLAPGCADVIINLSPEPVPDPAPTQAEFFEEEPVGPPRRPAPAGVLFLENGGGKSVLLKLIFSVMLPGHRNTLGGASSGVLRKFLLADDCGHVALEWQHTLTGECVVVGKVSEWRGRQVSNDPRKFAEAWYSFRPGPGLSSHGAQRQGRLGHAIDLLREPEDPGGGGLRAGRPHRLPPAPLHRPVQDRPP